MISAPNFNRAQAQSPCLSERLTSWLSNVPLYRQSGFWGSLLCQEPNLESTLSNLPFITKREIRQQFPHNFLRAGIDLESLLEQELVEVEHTSGTSEDRTPLLLPLGWWAEQEARALRLNRFVAEVLDEFPDTRRVTITPPVCNSEICYAGWPSHADRIVRNALFVNLSRYPFLWSEADNTRMASEAIDWAPQFLDVDPVYAVLFALYCERNQVRLPSLQFILCSYEFLSVVHRRILKRVFGVPIYNLYGSTETGHLLMENDRGRMIPSLETAFLENISENANGTGELVVTTLTNDYMPLVRYRIGDLVQKHENSKEATYIVHGRVIDTLRDEETDRVTTCQIDQCFDQVSGIAHYQLRQAPDGRWRLWFLPDGPGASGPQLAELRARLEHLLGPDTCLSIRPTDLLMNENSGKFRLTALEGVKVTK